MGISQVTISLTQLEDQRSSYKSITLTNWTTSTESAVAAGGCVEIGQSLFYATSETSISGYGSATTAATCYLLFTVSGTNVTASWTNSAPEWNETRSYYAASATSSVTRVIGSCYKRSNTAQDGKVLYETRNFRFGIDPNGNALIPHDLSFYDGFDQDRTLSFASDAYITWDESEDEYIFKTGSTAQVIITTNEIGMGGQAGGNNRDVNLYFATDSRLFWDESESRLNIYLPGAATPHIFHPDYFVAYRMYTTYPDSTGVRDFGDGTLYWNDISAKSFTDRSAIWLEDPDRAYNIIKNARNEESNGFCSKVESRGQNRLKYSDFPDYCWDKAEKEADEDIYFDDNFEVNENSFRLQNKERPTYKKGEKIISKGEKTKLRIENKEKINKDTKKKEKYKEIKIAAEGFDLSAGLSVCFGAIKKLINENELLKERIEKLENK